MSVEHAVLELHRSLPPRPSASEPMRPAAVHPGAVLVPPVAFVVLSVALTTGVQLIAGGPWLPAVALGLALPFALHVVRCIMQGTSAAAAIHVVAPLSGALFVLAVGLLAPAAWFATSTLVMAWVVAFIAVELGPRWRVAWMRQHPRRVTLLTSTELSAAEAIRRLETLSNFRVANVILPGGHMELASRQVDRPVHNEVTEDMELAGRVIVACPVRDPEVAGCVAQLVARGQRIQSESSALRQAEGRVDSRQANPISLLHSVQMSPVIEFLRRVISFVAAAVLLVLLAPLFLLIAAAIVLESGFPVFYRQTRVGFRGRPFQVVKFRTMYRDAESRSGPVFAAAVDPRVTIVGRFLRKYRLDELPQLWNVLTGEMAFVGPRPERPHFTGLLRKEVPLFELRNCVRPGLTGWAQIRLPYASDSDSARAKLEHDLFYLTHRSVFFDLAILFDTAAVALGGAGAR
ncbi:MAG: exopolysaccharide biosynthesis polyprenyl glycosylphosphotransferase [Planctomycetota bacterium]|nr:exopolysaccharide biosynthesis polyprenyl glycosylphosphotransferase [Planctomycetota bacterium]